uniref:G-protein coupled receptors family 2 profile 2 domain-containing protein n=1 Tax=Sinocyclocheilus anshuiensis TaxID=1608454 RepID=A0A671QE24_9TELE
MRKCAVFCVKLCRGEDVLVMSAEQESHIPESSADLSVARKQILSAQFECYLKIMYDPPLRKVTSARIGQTIFPNEMCDVSHCVPSEKVTKVCDSDGQWFHHPESNRLWSNYTQCSAYTKQKLEVRASLLHIKSIIHNPTLNGWCLRRCLSCQRITLHKNMFTSFILNSFATMAWIAVVVDVVDVQSQIGCKLLASIMQYTSCSNYFWMLCEGIYLHTLIIVAVFVGEQQLGWYYVLGWGFPVIPAVLYAVALSSAHKACIYLIQNTAKTNVYMKAVRATIILVPLLGAQFILVPLEPSGRVSRAVYEFFMNIFAHFQVMNSENHTFHCFFNITSIKSAVIAF